MYERTTALAISAAFCGSFDVKLTKEHATACPVDFQLVQELIGDGLELFVCAPCPADLPCSAHHRR